MFWNLGVIEAKDVIFVWGVLRLLSGFSDFFESFEKFTIGSIECLFRIPLALHKRVPNKEFTTELHVDS